VLEHVRHSVADERVSIQALSEAVRLYLRLLTNAASTTPGDAAGLEAPTAVVESM
jgi:hypothetical protein